MDIENVLSTALGGVISATRQRLSEKNPAPPIEDGEFDYVEKAQSKYFTAGFGKAVMLPDDIDKKTYYIAGYSENNPARGVIDPQYAHALWLDDNSGKGGNLFISLDIVGLLNKDVNKLKDSI